MPTFQFAHGVGAVGAAEARSELAERLQAMVEKRYFDLSRQALAILRLCQPRPSPLRSSLGRRGDYRVLAVRLHGQIENES